MFLAENPLAVQSQFRESETQPANTSNAASSTRARKSRLHIDSVVARTAARQLGLLTAAQVASFGVTAAHLEQRARVGMLFRSARQVYRIAAFPQSIEQHYLAMCFAVPGARISGIAAAMIHKLPVPRSFVVTSHRGLPLVELRIETGHRAAVRGAEVRRVANLGESIDWFGGLVATVPETLFDLARLVDRPTLERCLDHAISEGQTNIAALEALVSARPRLVNRACLLALIADRGGRGFLYRSKLEQTVGGWLAHSGFSPFVSNFIVQELGLEVDFAWPTLGIVLEVSPFYTHGSQQKQARDMERRLLLHAAGWIVIECTDAHLVSILSFEPILVLLRQHLQSA